MKPPQAPGGLDQPDAIIPAMRVLLVEDHRDIAENISDFLEPLGHEMDLAVDGATGLTLAQSTAYDVLIIDIMLPRMDGLDLVRALRAAGQSVPVLMLTARDSLEDKLEGFAVGADDYLIKPFALPELLARLLALHKRGAVQQEDSSPLLIADLRIDPATRQVQRAGQELVLNQSAYLILLTLARSAPQPVSQAQLTKVLWDDGEIPGSTNALRSHLYLLRQVVDKPFATALIQTIRGVGVVLREPL